MAKKKAKRKKAYRDDLILEDLECPDCDTVFTTQEGHLCGECPTCGLHWWLDTIVEDDDELPIRHRGKGVARKNKLRQDIRDKKKGTKRMRVHKQAVLSVEWGEPI